MKKMTIFILFILLASCKEKSNKVFSIEQKSVDTQSSQKIIKDSLGLFFPLIAKTKNNKILFEPDTLYLNYDDSTNYLITPSGKILETINKRTKIFNLKTNLVIELAYFYKHNNKLFVFYTETDMDGAASFLECINRTNSKSDFRSQIGAFNLGQPIVKNEYVYINSIGWIAKFKLTNGKAAWQHTNLYDSEKEKYNNFDTTLFQNDKIFYYSTKHSNKKVDTLKVYEVNGKIISK